MGSVSLHMPLFDREVRFVLFPADRAPSEVTDRMTAIVTDVLALQPSDLARVKELLWEECMFSFHVTDYGIEAQPGETPLQAYLRTFALKGPEDAYAQAEIAQIHVVDEGAGRFAEIKVRTACETYISLIVRNGRIIDFDDDGAYLPAFDEDEQHAHRQRQKVLAG